MDEPGEYGICRYGGTLKIGSAMRMTPMNKQPDNSRAAVPAVGSALAQSGRHAQSGRTFSPFMVPSPSEGEASQPSGRGHAVPIGRPVPDAVYQRLKEEAETAPPGPSAPKGHQDRSVMRSARWPWIGGLVLTLGAALRAAGGHFLRSRQ